MDFIRAAGMDDAYSTYVHDECFDIHDYDCDTDHDTDDDTDEETDDDPNDDPDDDPDDGGRGHLCTYQSSRLLFPGPWSLVLKIR